MTIAESSRSMEELFDLFCVANSFSSILQHFHQLCAVTLTNTNGQHPWNVYRELRTNLKSYWKAAALFEKLDKRVRCSEYMQQTACNGVNAVVVGCGPCGLRCAIELALLGARVVVIEKRDKFSRNNVLHLWPYLIDDLRALGAKTFFGKFCAGSIDHVSIRTLQCILLKAALLFGVQIFHGVTYQGLIDPSSDSSVVLNNMGVPTRIFLEPTEAGDTKSADPARRPSRQEKNSNSSRNWVPPERVSPSVQNGHVLHLGSSPAACASVGWRLRLNPEVNVLQNYEVDVLIGADGKRSCLGFPCKELRCRLAIAITANFINYHTPAETEVEEISGVSSIFNQQFFARLASETGIDLENIVYYKDETHYFVMTAKKHSLLNKGVLKQDQEDSHTLLSAENIDKQALQDYARETANYVTNGRLPRLDFATNARGEPDVDAFDFTRIFAAEYSCRMVEKKQHLLMQCLIGDGLFEPFWPTGSGCALGFLSALDAAWAVSRLAAGHNPLQVIAQRESVYQRLSQTTAQNMPPNFTEYTLDPRTRYTRCNLNLFGAHQVRHLYQSDRSKSSRSRSVQSLSQDPSSLKHVENLLKEQLLYAHAQNSHSKKDLGSTVPSEMLWLLRWFQSRLSFYESHSIVSPVVDLSSEEWDFGVELLCLIHLYRPELVPELEEYFSEKTSDPRAIFRRRNSNSTAEVHPKPNLIRACGILLEHFDVKFTPIDKDSLGIGYPRSDSDWLVYLHQVYCALRPMEFRQPPPPLVPVNGTDSKLNGHRNISPGRLTNGHHSPLRNRLSRSELNVSQSPRHTRGVVREDPNWSVEKGLLLKRRAEFMAGFLNSKSTKRYSQSVAKRAPVRIAKLLNQPSQDTVNTTRSNEKRHLPNKPVQISDEVAHLFRPSEGTSHCYVCSKRLYLIERQAAFGHYFHRHCFRCTTCGIQLQPDRATRVRPSSPSELDSFYCLTHSPSLESTNVRPGAKNRTDSTGASLVDRLRTGQFPFGKHKGHSIVESSKRLAATETSEKFASYQNRTSKVTQSQPLASSQRSALLAGLSDDAHSSILAPPDVRHLTRNFRVRQSSSSSSSSPARKPVFRRNIRNSVGPSGDSSPGRSVRLGFRDDDAPGPECYLAGHLGLPEVERRANWELNTMSTVPTTSIPDILEHMRLGRYSLIGPDDYFASSESDAELLSRNPDSLHWVPSAKQPAKSAQRRRLQGENTPIRCLSSTGSSTNLYKSYDPSSVSDPTTVSNTLSPSLTLLSNNHSSNPIHSKHLEAKHRFCLEPPKPLTIDPKQFIGAKNLERVISTILPDCTETTTHIDDLAIICCLPLITLISVPLFAWPQITSTKVWDLTDSAPTFPIESYSPRLAVNPLVQIRSSIESETRSSPGVVPEFEAIPTVPFAPLEDFRDIDSTSTVTERSSTEPTPEREESRSSNVRQPLEELIFNRSTSNPQTELPVASEKGVVTTNESISPKSSLFTSNDSSDTSSLDLNSMVSIRSKSVEGKRFELDSCGQCVVVSNTDEPLLIERRIEVTGNSPTHSLDEGQSADLKPMRKKRSTIRRTQVAKSQLLTLESVSPITPHPIHVDYSCILKDNATKLELQVTPKGDGLCNAALQRSASEPLLIPGYSCVLSTT